MHNSTDPYTSIPTALRGIAGYLIRSGHTIDPSVFEVLTHCANGVGALGEQAARIAELESQLEAIGAGGVEPLRSRCLHQITEPASVEEENTAPGLPDLAAHLRGECQDAIDNGNGFINVTRVLEIVNCYHSIESAVRCEWCGKMILDAESGPPCATRSQADRCDAFLAAAPKAEPAQPAGEYPALPSYGDASDGASGAVGYSAAQMRAYADATCAKRAAQFATADNRAAFKAYLEDCDECAIVPDIAGAFNAGWTSCVSAEQPAGAQAAPAAVARPSDGELLAEWNRVSAITDAGKRRLAVMRAVLAKWGATPTTQAAPQPAAQQGGYQAALNIRTAQGWKLTRKAIPVLYTDTINGQQVMRDDVWLCTSAALAQPHEAAPVAQGDADKRNAREETSIGKAVNRAALNLPEGWGIRIDLERHAGTVNLIDPEGSETMIEGGGDPFSDQISAAIDAAMNAGGTS